MPIHDYTNYWLKHIIKILQTQFLVEISKLVKTNMRKFQIQKASRSSGLRIAKKEKTKINREAEDQKARIKSHPLAPVLLVIYHLLSVKFLKGYLFSYSWKSSSLPRTASIQMRSKSTISLKLVLLYYF